ncbi:UDP-N-acetylmuramoyl-L-alanyl-D-glutamate--2,6-diaminopimelate ligase [Gracilibacillus alcaliphilus]|uniref:UDP-N-acetylmuramoyl-L-alanyl-D-glutamate--2, 6-diaminopimelate ligase n=1 Tax=Gracilibacillus alcaliphilus TaxID=1401441 RepID=UPI00195CE772|nr:UDP-N-acetylmuramoyl-L-alanyl-D-glutamate--2,6-diaminopimelate ligase [Gracilibacillus alcaliphilus]MBM7678625.1 UDP-N-acetylmuramoyl-L-alanyl-D-glutamate--2,6-diaminopimelate ligase [Gracilibacillus alcaliphilus]
MNAAELINNLPDYTCDKDLTSLEIQQIEMDHRLLAECSMFICIEGYTVDGHQYAEAAVQNGAAVIVAQKPVDVEVPVVLVPDTQRALALLANSFYQHPSRQLKVIGVTGTNGKTSVTHIIDEIHRYAKQRTAMIGTIQMTMDQEVYPVKNTTPDSLFLQKNLALMVEKDIDVMSMEVSSHALDLGRVHGVDIDIAVFTNLSQDHLDYHQTMDKYLFAKSLLFAQLGNSLAEDRRKYAIINSDDAHADFLMKATAQPIITYGVHHRSTFQATDVELKANGVAFKMKTPAGDMMVESRLMGMFSVYNLLAAAAASYASGIDLVDIQAVFKQTSGVKGRFQPVEHQGDFGVIIDYAHTPDSLENVLTTIKKFCKGKIHVIVGCGGDRDRTKRPLMAHIACQYADQAIFTSDNPRSESPEAILADMVDGIAHENYQVVSDREQAIQQAIQQAEELDVILIAGKGHETYQIIGEEVLDFDDEQIAKKYLD